MLLDSIVKKVVIQLLVFVGDVSQLAPGKGVESMSWFAKAGNAKDRVLNAVLTRHCHLIVILELLKGDGRMSHFLLPLSDRFYVLVVERLAPIACPIDQHVLPCMHGSKRWLCFKHRDRPIVNLLGRRIVMVDVVRKFSLLLLIGQIVKNSLACAYRSLPLFYTQRYRLLALEVGLAHFHLSSRRCVTCLEGWLEAEASSTDVFFLAICVAITWGWWALLLCRLVGLLLL